MRSRLCPVRLTRAHVHPCTISTLRSPSSPPSCIDQLDGYFNGKTAPWEASSSPGSGVAAPLQRALTPEQPVVPDPTWKRRGLSAYGGLNRTDPDAIWSFQGWAIVDWYVTFRLDFHHFDRFELDFRGDMHVWGAAFSCLRLKLADIVLI